MPLPSPPGRGSCGWWSPSARTSLGSSWSGVLVPVYLRTSTKSRRLAGQPAKLNAELLRSAAVRQDDLPYRHEGTVYDLTITYSDFHPYFRVEVTTGHRFRTHQQPFEGNLCLIRGGTWNWNVDETA